MTSAVPPSPFGDPKLPFLPKALDPRVVGREIAPLAARLLPDGAEAEVRQIRLVRHEPGRRCVIEYRFGDRRSPETPAVIVFAKLRARGADRTTHGLVEALRRAGLRAGESGVAVPEPIGIVPSLHMTLQRGAPGVTATHVLRGDGGGTELMVRVAEAIHTLHRTQVDWERQHRMSDELRILDQRLRLLADARPEWTERLERLLAACARLASNVPEAEPRGIHRDFYSDQLIVDAETLYLLDLDLYARGDPALDIGNFLGHLTEQALRDTGDPGAFADCEEALVERFLELCPRVSRGTLETYALLTLARHVHISTTLPARSHLTERLLELCEERLELGVRS